MNPTNPTQEASFSVMIVDDSSTMRGMMSRVLESHGAEVIASAKDGRMAISMLKRQEPQPLAPDVILLDSRMPEMDGLQALPEMVPLAPKSKIIFISTLNEDDTMLGIEALGKGAHELLAKPSSRKNHEEYKRFERELLEKVTHLTGIQLENKTKVAPQEPLDTMPEESSATEDKTPDQPQKKSLFAFLG